MFCFLLLFSVFSISLSVRFQQQNHLGKDKHTQLRSPLGSLFKSPCGLCFTVVWLNYWVWYKEECANDTALLKSKFSHA